MNRLQKGLPVHYLDEKENETHQCEVQDSLNQYLVHSRQVGKPQLRIGDPQQPQNNYRDNEQCAKKKQREDDEVERPPGRAWFFDRWNEIGKRFAWLPGGI